MLVLFILSTWCTIAAGAGCNAGDIAVYRMVLQTFWTEEKFPKNYPQYRPRAQWSQVFGESHDGSHRLYRVGELASARLREFSQWGRADALVAAGEAAPAVYDHFTAPAVGRGEGAAENVLFVDGEHDLVSLVCRLVPSPDWFVGVDSVELCVDGHWVDELSLSLEPLDAGAASGRSFTSPRWQTSPPAAVSRHTSRLPAHPASAFYYPELRHLPTIASVHFTKIKEYTTKDINDLAHEEERTKLNDAKRKQKMFAKQLPEVTTKNNLEVLKDLEEDPVGTPRPNLPSNHVIVVTERHTTSTTAASEFDAELRSSDDIVLAVARGRRLGRGKHLPRHFRSRLHNAINRITEDDCLVSEWSVWSACSATCGFGDKFRSRRVLREPTPPRGRACPELRQREHCGDANSCYRMEYFEW